MKSLTAVRFPFHATAVRHVLSGCLAAVAWVATGPVLAAQIVVTEFTGEVTDITVLDESIVVDLVNLGIIPGAPITLRVEIDTGVPGVPGVQPAYTFYEDALADFELVIGSYEAFYHHPVRPIGNNVQVGNDDQAGGIIFDAYTFATLCAETPDLLRGDGESDGIVFNVTLSDKNGKTIDDGNIVQDLKAFKFGNGSMVGSKGIVAFVLDVGSTKPSPLAFVQSGQLKTGGAFLRGVVQAVAKATALPSTKDPEGEKLQAAIGKAVVKLAKQLTKIADKAELKGVVPPLDLEDLPEFGDALLADLESLAEAITVDLDPENKVSRVLHAKLLRAAGKHLAADLVAYAAHQLKLPADKLQAKLEKSRAAHLAAAAKAIAAAAKKGLDYAGPATEDTADAVTALVDEIVGLVKG